MYKTNKKKSISIIRIMLIVLVALTATLNHVGAVEGAVENFNLEIEVPSEYQTVIPGEKLWFTTKILNLANTKRIDVILEYSLFSLDGELQATKSETVAIETQASFVGSIDIPEGVRAEDYDLQVSLLSEAGESAIGTTRINVKAPEDLKSFLQRNYIIIIVVVVLFIITIIAMKMRPYVKRYRKRSKAKDRIKEIIQNKITKNKITKKDLESSKLPSTPSKDQDEDKIF